MNADQTDQSETSTTQGEDVAPVATKASRKQDTNDLKKARKPSQSPATPAKTKQASKATVLPAKLTVPTPARELAQTVMQRLGHAQALRVYHSLGALLKKATAAGPKKDQVKPAKPAK